MKNPTGFDSGSVTKSGSYCVTRRHVTLQQIFDNGAIGED